MLFKEIVDGCTDGRTPDIEGSQKLTEHFVLRWAKKSYKVKPWTMTLNLIGAGVQKIKSGHETVMDRQTDRRTERQQS